MPKVKQANFSTFEVYCMNMLLSLPEQSPKDELFGKVFDCLVRHYKKTYVRIISPLCKASKSSVHETESSRDV